MKETKHTRRHFIKAGAVGTAALALVLWDKMIGKHREISSARTISVPFNPNQEVSFFDEFIVVNQNDGIRVFSSRCTHLGCKINGQSGNSLLCPCHGSSFNLSGDVTRGPAIRALENLSFELSDDNKTITVKMT